MYFNQKSILAADYLRLSREDGDKLESDSIRNQRSLINDFVKQHKEIQLVEEYIDDGYSGTNFDRPAFQRIYHYVNYLYCFRNPADKRWLYSRRYFKLYYRIKWRIPSWSGNINSCNLNYRAFTL